MGQGNTEEQDQGKEQTGSHHPSPFNNHSQIH